VRAVIQRVSSAGVTVDGEALAEIGQGVLVLVGIASRDTRETVSRMAAKVVSLRIFEDAEGRMNLSLRDMGGSVLCVSQFTLYGDIRRGNRPSFTDAAPPAEAEQLYSHFCEAIEAAGVPCARGLFGARMEVDLRNSGPVTILLDSEDFARPRQTQVANS
jgi:D-tyrosyl-tRNA(Tyr) deacylase